MTRCLDSIIDNHIDLFFESGDCPAFVARGLGCMPNFQQSVANAKRGNGTNLFTNNILAFLQLLMNDQIPVTMLPKSSPQDVYGASYGILDDLIADDRTPDYSGKEIPEHALQAFNTLANSDDALTLAESQKLLLVCSISGVQLSDKHQIDADYDLNPELVQQIDECRGFHVGSFRNLVFKRYLYSTGAPILMTTTRAMLDMPIDPLRCHFLFNKIYTWYEFFSKHPLAFLVGCKSSQIEETKQILNPLKYEQTSQSMGAFGAVLAANPNFLQATNISLN